MSPPLSQCRGIGDGSHSTLTPFQQPRSPRRQLSLICLLKNASPVRGWKSGDHRGSLMSTTDNVFCVSPTFPFPGANCERPNAAPRGLGGGNLGAQIGPDPIHSPWWGGSARWEPPAASRAPSFLAARHRPLCPRPRRGVLTARTSFSGACSLGRLRRCMPVPSAAFLTGCTISTPPATRVGTPRMCFRVDTRANLRRDMEDRKRRFANKARRCTARSPMFSRRRFQALPDASTPW